METMETAPLILGRNVNLTRNIDDYPAGIIIPVDKPYRWTSADVIRKIKFTAVRRFGRKNLKVGHAGTLDPLATGILLVCIGKATRLAETLQSHDKEYVAGISFGATTPSYDREKDIDRRFPHTHITEDAVRKALEGFIGEQDQIAPLFSAKSVEGVRAYEIARKMMRHGGGEGIDETAAGLIRSARICISEAELLDFVPGDEDSADTLTGCGADTGEDDGKDIGEDEGKDTGEKTIPTAADSRHDGRAPRINVTDNSSLGLTRAVVRISCSKGTYVRAFARDLGEALGSGAHLDSLIRSRSGDFRIQDALSMENVLDILKI